MHAGLSIAREDANSLTLVYRPSRTKGLAVGAILLAVVVAAASALGWQAARQPIGPALFAQSLGVAVLVATASLLGYWLYGCLNLAYIVAPGRLIVRWAGERHSIAAAAIERVLPGDAYPLRRPDGPDWPGYHVGRTAVPALGPVLAFSTHRQPSEVTYVITAEVAYALAVGQTWINEALARPSVRETRPAVPSGEPEPTVAGVPAAVLPAGWTIDVRRWRLLELGVWSDGLALALLGAGLMLNLLLFNLVLSAYPTLPSLLPVHFASNGEIDRIGDRAELLRLPFMALAVWIGNGVLAALIHRWERLAAILLLSAGIGFQVLFLVATAKIAG